jgi:hypothetical protein
MIMELLDHWGLGEEANCNDDNEDEKEGAEGEVEGE